MFVKADFHYEPDRDVYRCPAGNALTYRYTREEDGLQLRRYWINDCQYCPLQHRCTSGKERRITRWEHEHLIDEMRQRLGRDPDAMTLRRCTVEHPFGGRVRSSQCRKGRKTVRCCPWSGRPLLGPVKALSQLKLRRRYWLVSLD